MLEDTDERLPDEAEIECLVSAFYEKARQDTVLGPIFARHVSDWDDHLRRISDARCNPHRTPLCT